ncbi:LLM class flavin-dependent oxidoreductase [Egibacter rhizosphaerae]|uniref:LLM class flavin-dependent oxidoreductase n=1 Tax=Egibacter rhizosphaerae TaxID=1670831 RepID=A0A411YF51_9ACTN|nr:LLM class flavin-dependent oxidoreductase [Egibacter rhizosphaerae]QBI19855.1 LLM class flavin-dependent oxidoreductase [Egibacter rhizosphaerae]
MRRDRPEIGLGFQSDKTAEEYAELARAAEAAGFDVLSVFSDLMYQPPVFPLLVMAGVTERVRLGPACLNPYSLAPFEIAGQTAALDLASHGRAYVGMARGAWLGDVGIEQTRPVTTLREAATVVGRLLGADDRGFEGEVFRLARGTRLAYEPARSRVPLLIGTWGPRAAALAGEIADEVKIGGTANPDMVSVMRERIRVGADAVGRDVDEVGVVVGAVTVVARDGDEARRHARREVAMYIDVVADLDPTLELPSDLLTELRGHLQAGRPREAGAAIPDDLLDRFAFAGDPDHVAAIARGVLEAGAARVEFGTPHGLTDREGVELLGREVLPKLR